MTDTTNPSIREENRTRSRSTRQFFWLLSVPVLIVLLFVYCCIRLIWSETRRRRMLQIQRRSPRNHLRLSRWRQLHEELIDKEKESTTSVTCSIEPIVIAEDERATTSERDMTV
ncbi:hypothetical protein KXD40_004757 [Peronospora effusa]|uniref:Uncharacterized protein n=1 Tax=Peronospora effusa TaxID=542832 RepID=A0A3M6VMX8_9STRA|nr:hypothetical protein DD238_004750 [Peronospora effusa]UIZ28441.1 hypothetical protein KXD40_004757 [Peronospora effusa]